MTGKIAISEELSASAIEVYADCSMKYYYRYILKIKKEKVIESNYENWLNKAEFGSLLHEMLELAVININNGMKLDKSIKDGIDTALRNMELKIPYLLRDHYDKIKSDSENICNIYLDEYYKNSTLSRESIENINEDVILVSECEYKFGKKYDRPIVVSIDEYDVNLTGIIDRVDIWNNDTISIVDYKTGNYENFKKKIEEQHFQDYLYREVVKNLVSQGEFENISKDIDLSKIDVRYDFPFNFGEESYIKGEFSNKEELLKDILKGISEKTYEKNKENCVYCDYNIICRSNIEEE